MGNKWYSQHKCKANSCDATIRPKRCCYIYNPGYYFQYIVIFLLLNLSIGHIVVVGETVRPIPSTTTWQPSAYNLHPSLDHKVAHENSSMEHIYLRDITKNGYNSGK